MADDSKTNLTPLLPAQFLHLRRSLYQKKAASTRKIENHLCVETRSLLGQHGASMGPPLFTLGLRPASYLKVSGKRSLVHSFEHTRYLSRIHAARTKNGHAIAASKTES